MWNKHPYRAVLWALLLSLLVHLLLIARMPWSGWSLSMAEPIVVELQPPPPPALPARAPARTIPHLKKVAKAKPKQVAPPPLEHPEPAPQPVPQNSAPAPEDGLQAASAPSPETADAATDSAYAGETEIPQDPPSGEEALPPPPTHVEIDYRILHKGSVVGTERQAYRIDPNGRYTLTSVAEPKGLLALALSDLVQRSEGEVTEHGLRPSSYVYQYGKNPDKAQRATFDWVTYTVRMEAGGRTRTASVTDGVQDLMSFMFQFMFVPPLQEMHLSITNGKRLKTYDYGFEGEEDLSTAIGTLHCMHIVKSSGDGEEKAEAWLAVDYHYLPVKIRKTEEDGTVTERNVTRLLLE